jgi:hypothetical protein
MTDLRIAPWRTTGSRLVHAHRPLSLFEDQVLDAAGALRVRHRLVEPESTRVVAVDSDGLLALVWHWRYPLGYPGIELPSAAVRPGEDPRATAQRALRDGCGLAARNWTGIGTVTVVTEVAAQTVHLYRADNLHRTPRPVGDGQRWAFTMPYRIAVGSVVAGAVGDAGSIAGLLLAEQLRLAGEWESPEARPPRPPWLHRV